MPMEKMNEKITKIAEKVGSCAVLHLWCTTRSSSTKAFLQPKGWCRQP